MNPGIQRLLFGDRAESSRVVRSNDAWAVTGIGVSGLRIPLAEAREAEALAFEDIGRQSPDRKELGWSRDVEVRRSRVPIGKGAEGVEAVQQNKALQATPDTASAAFGRLRAVGGAPERKRYVPRG